MSKYNVPCRRCLREVVSRIHCSGYQPHPAYCTCDVRIIQRSHQMCTNYPLARRWLACDVPDISWLSHKIRVCFDPALYPIWNRIITPEPLFHVGCRWKNAIVYTRRGTQYFLNSLCPTVKKIIRTLSKFILSSCCNGLYRPSSHCPCQSWLSTQHMRGFIDKQRHSSMTYGPTDTVLLTGNEFCIRQYDWIDWWAITRDPHCRTLPRHQASTPFG